MTPHLIIQNWIAVASAEHVRRGRTAGFMQVCHGKAAPLRRIQPHDRVAYYSPTIEFRGSDKCQAFTGLGIVRDWQPYRPTAEGDFSPYRRDVTWLESAMRQSRRSSTRLSFPRDDAIGDTNSGSACFASARTTCEPSPKRWALSGLSRKCDSPAPRAPGNRIWPRPSTLRGDRLHGGATAAQSFQVRVGGVTLEAPPCPRAQRVTRQLSGAARPECHDFS